MIKTAKIKYQDKATVLEGFYAYDDAKPGKRPLVLVAHDWSGRNEFADNKAKMLAELGYVGFALDMNGEGIIGDTVDEKMALIKPFMEDRALLSQRILSALECAKGLEFVDTTKVGAIGFCFGGLCVLDLARSGANVSGVVSFHGLLGAPEIPKKADIKAKILVLHGHDDPMVPPEQVLGFEKEMTAANVDWQVHVFSHTKHAFMNPNAHDNAMGTVYNKLTEKRAWLAMKDFFVEVLG